MASAGPYASLHLASLQTDNHASTPPLSFLQDGCPSCRPTNSVKALKAKGVLPTKWRQKPAGIDMNRNYVTVTQCIHVTDQGKSNWRFQTYDVNKAYHHSSCSCHEIRLNILLPRLYQRHDDVKWKMTTKHRSIWRHLNLFKTHYNNCQWQYFYYAINIRNISNSQVCLLLNLLTWKYSLCTIHLYRESEIVS